jgi:hypothetical protein
MPEPTTSFPDVPWPDPDFARNAEKIPIEELMRYAGQYVAYSWDGTQIVGGHPTLEGLHKQLVDAGFDLQHVVFGQLDDA